MKYKQPLVSVCCTTYNHENYIRDVIEGFLIQKITFPFEIIIHDDASTDGTTEIIKEYADKYPELIVPIFQTQNQYSQGIKPWPNFVFPKARGKYIALCEGDDYWTDPYKLQKQVGFLEANREYGLVHGDSNFYIQTTQKWEYNANKFLSNAYEIKDKRELFNRLVDADYKIRTATVLFKKELLNKIKANDRNFAMGDTPMWLDFSQITKFKYIDDLFAVYRIISESVSRSKNKQKQLYFTLSMAEMRVYYCNKFHYPINEKLKIRYNKSLLNYKIYNYKYKEIYSFFASSNFTKLKTDLISLSIIRNICIFKNDIKNKLKILFSKITVL